MGKWTKPISATTWERVAAIRDGIAEGEGLLETGATLGISRTRTFQIAHMFRIKLPPSNNRRFEVNCPIKLARVIQQVARERGAKPSDVVRALLVYATALDAATTHRRVAKAIKIHPRALS